MADFHEEEAEGGPSSSASSEPQATSNPLPQTISTSSAMPPVSSISSISTSATMASSSGTSAATPSSAPAATVTSNTSATSHPPGAAAAAAAGPAPITSPPHQHIHATLPLPQSETHVAEARAAVVASLGNMLDRELRPRASVLHENAAALTKQEVEVQKATEALRKDREKLGREVEGAARKVKELGNVQNWAEVLERGFLVLEETVRLANGGEEVDAGEQEGEEDGGSVCSCSCSECMSDARSDGTGRMDVDMDYERIRDAEDTSPRQDEAMDASKDQDDGNGKGQVQEGAEMVMDSDGGLPGTWSGTSRSLMEQDSSTGTGQAKSSETASMSTEP